MSNPNLVTVYSPANEPFETSRANARDLTSHAGWSYAPLDATAIAAATVPAVKEEKVAAPKVEETKEEAHAAPSEGSDEVSSETGEADEGEADEAAEEAGEKVEVTEADFAHLEDRDDVVAVLAEKFPDFKPHHKSGRDKLVEKLVELTNG